PGRGRLLQQPQRRRAEVRARDLHPAGGRARRERRGRPLRVPALPAGRRFLQGHAPAAARSAEAARTHRGRQAAEARHHARADRARHAHRPARERIVSLLLDALKRAEQEKLTRQSDRPPEPVPRVVPAAQLAAQVLELQPLTSAASAAGASAAPRTDAQLAQAVFKAKAGAEPKSRRRILWAAAGVIALVAIAVGIYFWHSVNALAPHRQPLAAPRPAPIAPAPVASPQPGAAPADAATKASGAERKPPAESGLPAAASHGEAKRESTPVEDLLKQPQPAVAPPVQLARDTGEPKPRVAPAVDAGYRALLAGDLAAARRHYAAAVEADSTSVDAQLGLATVEARTGNVAGAARAYRRALELDPRNATALAGLAALAENAPPEALENDLSGEIAQHPDSAA